MTISESGLRWFEERGIDAETAGGLGVEASDAEIIIPFFLNGARVNRKYRKIESKAFRQDKGGEQVLWNHDCLLDATLHSHPVVITEGEIDAITAIQSGFHCVVSVPGGAPSQSQGRGHYHYIESVLPLLQAHPAIILATDNDEPGRILHRDLIAILGRARCKFVNYCGDAKDLNDVLQWDGQDAVRECLERADWVELRGIYTMSELPPIPNPPALSTGWNCLNPHWKMRRGDFTVITGIPGHGKSSWVTELCCRMARGHNWRSCIASFETPPQTEHRHRLVSWYYGRASHLVTDQSEATAWLDRWFTFMHPGTAELASLEWLIDQMESAATRYFADLIVIDPWNELDHERPRDMPMTEYINYAIKEIKLATRRLNVHTIIVAHPKKLSKEDAKNVSLYDISDSAAWANKADVGVVVERHPESNKSTIHIRKSRYHDRIGRPGKADLWFDEGAYCYRETNEVEPML